MVFVTERAVFDVREDGLKLTEIAPSIDLERKVLVHMDPKPIVRDVKRMDARALSRDLGRSARGTGVARISP